MGVGRHRGVDVGGYVAQHAGQQVGVHPDSAMDRVVIFIQGVRRQPGRVRQQAGPFLGGHLDRLFHWPSPYLLVGAATAGEIVRPYIEQVADAAGFFGEGKTGVSVDLLLERLAKVFDRAGRFAARRL